ncbi:hypothetical protein JCM30237_13420 [Halolamina litorea]|uniref:5-methyltetrahydropteroyltriglutamate--homocysteine methyltransferase n=1 Tax=Halolamina litorea TaxID=1515593 RepID=A0ABD6BNH0_9EURY|nr:5-methyltetrahydropteroyltriglutamate--homocysteine methyltransferase [Halolamina litorea]
MTDRVATTVGLFPSPEGSTAEQAREAGVDAQRGAGIDHVVEGQAGWSDLTAPLARHDAVEQGEDGLRIEGELTPTGTLAAEHAAAAALLTPEESLHAVVPGPYTLARRTDRGADALAPITDYLAGEVAALPDHGTLSILDPALVTDPPGDGVDARASEAIDTLAGASGADTVLQTWGAAYEEKPYAHLMDADVDAFAFDFVAGDRETHLYNVTEFGTKDSVALGLVDARDPDLEDPGTVADRVDWVLGRIPSQTFETAYIVPNGGLASLPTPAFREKLAALAGAVVAPSE